MVIIQVSAACDHALRRRIEARGVPIVSASLAASTLAMVFV